MLQQASTTGSRYQTYEMIGRGGMGAVYRVLDRLTGRTIALKRVVRGADDLDFEKSSAIRDRELLALALANEFQILARLRHPHIVSVLDFGFEADQQPYFTMDLVLNPRKINDAAQDQTESERVRLLLQLLEALAYLHRRGIIHRDLKPDNVLVDEQGQVRVLDFGLALTAQYARTQEDALYGTLAYIAPEVLTGKAASVASDLYGFGLIAYAVFSGGYPFDTSSQHSLVRVILNDLPDLDPLSAPLAPVVGRLLAKDPDDRYRSVDAAMEALCRATRYPRPQETQAIRESYLQSAAFIDHEAELRRLQELMRAEQNGKGAVCLIAGESGVGKSRLLNEVRVRALVANVLVLPGQAVAEGGSPYQVWRGIMQWLCAITDLSDLEAQVLKDLVPNIEDILQKEVPDAPGLSGQAAQERLINVVSGIFRRQNSARDGDSGGFAVGRAGEHHPAEGAGAGRQRNPPADPRQLPLRRSALPFRTDSRRGISAAGSAEPGGSLRAGTFHPRLHRAGAAGDRLPSARNRRQRLLRGRDHAHAGRRSGRASQDRLAPGRSPDCGGRRDGGASAAPRPHPAGRAIPAARCGDHRARTRPAAAKPPRAGDRSAKVAGRLRQRCRAGSAGEPLVLRPRQAARIFARQPERERRDAAPASSTGGAGD